MKYLILTVFTMCLFLAASCGDECMVEGNCALQPEVGPCNAAIPIYYYDRDDGVCKEFIWGGCAGVVPFETLEACQADCGCN